MVDLEKQSWVEKYAANIVVALVLAVLIWIGTSVADLNRSMAEIKVKLDSNAILNQQKNSDLERRLVILEDWKDRQQEKK